MHILFLSDNFPPEGNAPATRVYEHAVNWVRDGHEVTVLTCAPNFPEGKLFPGYRNRWRCVEEMDGIKVVRVKTYITANEGFLRRTLDYLSFMVSAFLMGCLQPRIDVVVATSPQFFAALGGWLLAAVRRRPFVFEVRDLWPASIVAVGAMSESIVVRWLEKIELFLYRRADAVVTVTEAYKRDLTGRGIAADKIEVVMNGIDFTRCAPRARDAELAAVHGTADRFVVGYIGTHGMAHALHRVLEAAQLLEEEKDVVFLFVGGGAARERLVKEARRLGLRNVRLIPRQPKELMPSFLSLCSVTLIHLKDDPLFETVIPSKIFEAMGMGLPILLAAPEGEATTLVRTTGAGEIIPPERPDHLARAVLELRDQPARREQLARAALEAAPRYSRKRLAAKMLMVFHAVIEGRRARGDMLPKVAVTGPSVEQVMQRSMDQEGLETRQHAICSEQEKRRQDYLTRLLVSAAYGAFKNEVLRIPKDVVVEVQDVLTRATMPEERSHLNLECQILCNSIPFRRDRDLWTALWESKQTSYRCSMILVRVLLALTRDESKSPLCDVSNSLHGHHPNAWAATSVLGMLVQQWLLPVRDKLVNAEFRQQLEQQFGYHIPDRAKTLLAF